METEKSSYTLPDGSTLEVCFPHKDYFKKKYWGVRWQLDLKYVREVSEQNLCKWGR